MRGIISRFVNKIADDATRSMEIFVGFLFMLDGLYVASPWYHPSSPSSPLLELAADRNVRVGLGLLYFFLGGLAFLSAVFGKTLNYRRMAAMSLFLVSLFAFLFRLSVFGFHPSGWIFALMLAGVFACDWLHINKCLVLRK